MPNLLVRLNLLTDSEQILTGCFRSLAHPNKIHRSEVVNMLVHIHGAEERTCDGCGRSSVIFDVRGERSECGLSLCQKCLRDFTSTLVQAAARIKENLTSCRFDSLILWC
jgi:hypothetical protein